MVGCKSVYRIFISEDLLFNESFAVLLAYSFPWTTMFQYQAYDNIFFYFIFVKKIHPDYMFNEEGIIVIYFMAI